MTSDHRATLLALFDTAIAAAHPDVCLPPHLPAPPAGRIIVLAAGKAAGSMAAAAEAHYFDALGLDPERLTGLAVTRYGYARPTRVIRMIEAGHPVPDEAGIAASEETLRLAATAGPDDLVLVLLSGGGSALWIAHGRRRHLLLRRRRPPRAPHHRRNCQRAGCDQDYSAKQQGAFHSAGVPTGDANRAEPAALPLAAPRPRVLLPPLHLPVPLRAMAPQTPVPKNRRQTWPHF
jgi:hypothetical protein